VPSLLEIGGYFGLDLPDHGDPFPHAIKFQSGRAALRAVVERAGIVRAWLPAYICDAAIQAVNDAGAFVETYLLDDSLFPKGLPSKLPDRSAILYVNYFGLCDANITRLLQRFPHKQLIIDNAQALFSLPTRVLASVYSPRKFVGVPDGGLLMSRGLGICGPEREDSASLDRMRHLLRRMAETAEEGYADYLESEKSLDDTKPLAMSRITRRILAGIDMPMVRQRRRANFLALAKHLRKYNIHKWELDAKSVPLCYPLVVGFDVQQLKSDLIHKRIYIPTYWPNCRPRVADGIEHRLTEWCLPVPCDQRYSLDHMANLAGEIVASLE
jgi:hypothetical protein